MSTLQQVTAMAFIAHIFVVGTLLNQAFCHPNVDRQSNVGIIGGHKINIERAPYMASLHMGGRHGCGASIIHEEYLLTAAHCLMHVGVTQVSAYVGTANADGTGGQLAEVANFTVHDGFSFEDADFDVALIKLKKPLAFGAKVAKIKLATPGQKVPDGVKLNITGWGRHDVDSYTGSKKLLQVQVPKINLKKCQQIYDGFAFNISSRMICSGNRGHTACHGDSGGPLTLGDVQVGITSFGKSCGKDPVVYTKVASMLCWILEQMYLLQ